MHLLLQNDVSFGDLVIHVSQWVQIIYFSWELLLLIVIVCYVVCYHHGVLFNLHTSVLVCWFAYSKCDLLVVGYLCLYCIYFPDIYLYICTRDGPILEHLSFVWNICVYIFDMTTICEFISPRYIHIFFQDICVIVMVILIRYDLE